MTHRQACEGEFYEQIERLAESEKVSAILLREKDLSQEEYQQMARKVLAICGKQKKTCILHNFYQVAEQLGEDKIHLPLGMLRENRNRLTHFSTIGTSIHSVEEAKEAEKLGATYLTAGHIFETDCKKGLPPRGLSFLHDVCRTVSLPVYGIGGITIEKLPQIMEQGAAGGCIMSESMKKNSILL